MSATLTVTNTTTSTLFVPELYARLGPSGSATASISVVRSMSQIDSMIGLKSLVHAGTVTVDVVNSTDNQQGMSVPQAQWGAAPAMDVSSMAGATQAVVFPEPYDASVLPNMSLTVIANTVQGFKATPYVTLLTHAGFTVLLDVTTAASGAVSGEAPTFSPLFNSAALGPFTATLADIPLTSGTVTLHWTESTVAKIATITGTSTLGGANAASLASASINRTTGLLTITFASSHAPDTGSGTVDYTQVHTADVHWTARY